MCANATQQFSKGDDQCILSLAQTILRYPIRQACEAVYVRTLHSSHSIMGLPSSLLAPHTHLTNQPSLKALFVEKWSPSCVRHSAHHPVIDRLPGMTPMTEGT